MPHASETKLFYIVNIIIFWIFGGHIKENSPNFCSQDNFTIEEVTKTPMNGMTAV